jgi:hypothetical protein
MRFVAERESSEEHFPDCCSKIAAQMLQQLGLTIAGTPKLSRQTSD